MEGGKRPVHYLEYLTGCLLLAVLGELSLSARGVGLREVGERGGWVHL